MITTPPLQQRGESPLGSGTCSLFWEDSDCRIHHGDAMAFLRELPAHSVNVILTDPPFFTPATHYQSRVSWGRSWGDMSILGEFFFMFAQEVKRVLKPEGHLACFCHDESYPVFYPVAFGMWDFTAGLIWDKTRPGLGKIFRHQYEMILWASNSGAYAKSDGVLHADILRHAPTLTRDRTHPVEKPVSLLKELLGVLTAPGHVVLDPFMGSGTTLAAAKAVGCVAWGVEMELRYCEGAADRLDGMRADARKGQGDLFAVNVCACGNEIKMAAIFDPKETECAACYLKRTGGTEQFNAANSLLSQPASE